MVEGPRAPAPGHPVLSPQMVTLLVQLGGVTTRLESMVHRLETSTARRRIEDRERRI